MKRIGIFCTDDGSHLRTHMLIASELEQRGHAVTLFNVDSAEERVRREGLNFCAYGARKYSANERYGRLMSGDVWVNTTLERIDMICRSGPELIREHSIDLLLVDQLEPGGSVVSDIAGIPFVSICNALPWNSHDLDVPPIIVGDLPQKSAWGHIRNRFTYFLLRLTFLRIVNRLNFHRRRAKLPPYRTIDDSFSRWAQISTLVKEFDFPRKTAGTVLHRVGPVRTASSGTPNFPFERLDGRPLVYASIGTMLGIRKDIYQMIAEACSTLNCQLVIGLGGCCRPIDLGELPGNPIAVEYAPQVDLLARAHATISHGGLNSVLEALSFGVPILAIPFSGDQPGIAARIRWHGVGLSIPSRKIGVERLRTELIRILEVPEFSKNAQRMRSAFAAVSGLCTAGDIIEMVMTTGSPVVSNDRGTLRKTATSEVFV